MKNRIKSALSLLLSFMMVLSVMPVVSLAATEIEDATVTVFNADGSEDGILDSTVTVDILSDNWYYTHHEGNDLGASADATAVTNNLARVAKFTQADSGIAWSWADEVTVKRIDLWIHTEGGVKDYEIQTSDDGENWNDTVFYGSFDPHYEGTMYDRDMSLASYYPIVLEEAVRTRYIRFVIKSFIDNTETAYIAEAKVYDTNMINLGEIGLFSSHKARSPYLWGFMLSGHTGSFDEQTKASYTGGTNTGGILPAWSSGKIVRYPTNDHVKPEEGIWYATSFYRSKAKINRIGFDVLDGTVTEFEVWASVDGGKANSWEGNPAPPINSGSWKKIATIGCNITADNGGKDGVMFDLPNAINANGIFLRATKYTPATYAVDSTLTFGTKFNGFYFYSVADSELSGMGVAAENLMEGIEVSAGKDSINIENTFEYEGDTYDVAWSSDSELIDIETGKISYHSDDVEVTLTAKVSKQGESKNYYITDKKITLPVRENSVSISVSDDVEFESGKDASILNDGFLYSAYDSKSLQNTSVSANYDKFAKVTENSYIEYEWIVPDSLKRINLWSYPAGAIEEYEIYISDDKEQWNKITSEELGNIMGEVDENAPDNQASYYPILFENVTTKHLRFVIKKLADDVEFVYISESEPSKNNTIDFLSAPLNAEGKEISYSHYMSSFVLSNTSEENLSYRKSSTAVWPVFDDGTSPQVKSDGSIVWYATGFTGNPLKVNRIMVPFLGGSANEIEVLCAEGDSGFELQSEYPNAPDTVTTWKSVTRVRGSFNSYNPAEITITNAPIAKYWMIKVGGVSSETSLGRPEFYLADEKEFSPITEFTSKIFDFVTTDISSGDVAKTSIGLFDTYNYNGKEYNVKWESTSALLNCQSGMISDHEFNEYATVTAIVTDPEDTSVSYCIKKKFLLKGLLEVTVFGDGVNVEESSKIADKFTFSTYDVLSMDAPTNACYNLDKFVHFTKVDSGFEYHWENEKVIKRLELWAWPVDSIAEYEIQVSNNGVEWDTHYSGEIVDQYKDTPDLRPDDGSDAAARSVFYSIVFDEPTIPAKYFRFVIKKFRDDSQGAYICEAEFKNTNNVNYTAIGSVEGTEKNDRRYSKYTEDFYLSEVDSTMDTAFSFRRNLLYIWPMYSAGSVVNVVPREGDILWYTTSFPRSPVKINKASIDIIAGEAYEIEIMCPATSDTGIKWANYPERPDTVAEWVTVARVSGKFSQGTVEFNFDNDIASKNWLIKVNEFSSDLKISGVGLYELGEYELNKSGFVLDNVFTNVSDTELDNVVKEKMNLPSSITVDGEAFDVIWYYDDTVINPDGSVIPAIEDRKMTLKAHVGSSADDYKHVLEKDFYILGNDNRARTDILKKDNINLSGTGEQIAEISLGNDFRYQGRKEVLIDFSNTTTGGRLELRTAKELLLDIAVKDGAIIINEGSESEKSIPFNKNIKFAIEDGTYTLYGYNGETYEVLIYSGALYNDKTFEFIKICGADGKVMAVDNLTIKALSDELLNTINDQFVFSKISPSYRATNLNGDLSLIEKVADVSFKYESGDENLIKIEGNTGVVNTTSAGETYVKVIGTSAETGAQFTKIFNVIVGKDNAFATAKSVSPATPVEGKSGEFAVDGSLETEFVTNSPTWRVGINLTQVTAFNKIRIIEADTLEKIKEYSIYVSDNNVDFTKIHSGKEINNDELITVPYSEARFVKIEVELTSGNGTGIKEICAYNEMSDKEKLDYDFTALTTELTISNGTVIPKTGRFGTIFTLSSDNDSVTIVETEDKNSWKVVVGSSSEEVNVNITLNAVNGSESAVPKIYTILLFADSDIRDNEITQGGNTGSGGGSGGGGSSGGVKETSDNVAFTPDTSQTQIDNAVVNELNGHWGAEEIKTLILKGIVEGDGKSLSLGRSVTRAEFCKMIITALGIEISSQKGSFIDVSENDWFSGYAQTALEYGIMSGDSSGFRGNDVISRQEMAVVLINALKSLLPELVTESEVEFADNENIAYWAGNAVKLAAGLNLLNGYENGEFRPENNLRRDEAMVVIYRMLSYVDK